MVPPVSQTQGQPQAEVVQLFDPERRNPSRPPPPTDAELIEYRLLRPRLLAMLEQWEALTSPSGCPVARQILLGR